MRHHFSKVKITRRQQVQADNVNLCALLHPLQLDRAIKVAHVAHAVQAVQAVHSSVHPHVCIVCIQ